MTAALALRARKETSRKDRREYAALRARQEKSGKEKRESLKGGGKAVPVLHFPC
jgi:hypothetical protein